MHLCIKLHVLTHTHTHGYRRIWYNFFVSPLRPHSRCLNTFLSILHLVLPSSAERASAHIMPKLPCLAPTPSRGAPISKSHRHQLLGDGTAGPQPTERSNQCLAKLLKIFSLLHLSSYTTYVNFVNTWTPGAQCTATVGETLGSHLIDARSPARSTVSDSVPSAARVARGADPFGATYLHYT